MKKFFYASFAFLAIATPVVWARAQMMGAGHFGVSQEIYEHTAEEEKEGEGVWRKFQNKEKTCADLTDEDLGVLGEYFMGQMTGTAHPMMNAMLIAMHGEEGEEEIHVAMGKRLSGCDPSADASAGGGWGPMMNAVFPFRQGVGGLKGGWSLGVSQDRSSPFGLNSTNNMMNFGYGLAGFLGGFFMILWWVLIIAGIVALVKWIARSSHDGVTSGKSAMDIVRERYAKGEIDKKEYEEKMKELAR